MRNLILFVVGGLSFGAAALGVGFALSEHDVLVQGGTALGLTFIPAAASLGWVLVSYRTSPEMQLLASLGGSGLRMLVALGGGLLLTQSQPQTYATPFWLWLVMFYLVFLGFEITLIVRQQSGVNGPPQA